MTSDEHIKAVTNLAVSGAAVGVSWMTKHADAVALVEHLIHVAANLVAIVSGISAAVFYIKSVIHKQWKE